MSLSPRHIAGFTAAVTVALALSFAVPVPYPDGALVERSTGRVQLEPWRQLDALRQSGDVGTMQRGLQRLHGQPRAEGGASVAHGIGAMLARETGPLDFSGDAAATAPVEAFFAGVAPAFGKVDAQAAALRQRLLRGEQPPPGELLALADAFRRLGRQRAQWRWFERTFRNFPSNAAAADGLLSLYLAHGRLDAAMQVVESHAGDRTRDVGWQRRVAQLGAWLARPEVEIAALECVVAAQPDPVDRSRLIALYSHTGTPERALPHAVALVDGAVEIAAAEEAAGTALRAGFVDEGLSMLRRAAARSPDASPWLRRFAELALQDLRVPEVRVALESAAGLDSVAAEQELEDLYRRTDQPERLADLLQLRLLRTPADAQLWHEVTNLRYSLGQRDQAQALAAQRDLALADPERFIASLPPEMRAEARAVRQQALSLTLAGGVDGRVVGETLEQLRPFLEQPGFRALAEALLAQHPNDPRAKSMRRELVDVGRTPLAAERAAAALSASYPDDAELVRFWLDRAQWSDQVAAQLEARQRLLVLAPQDRENRHELADLLEFAGDRRTALAHWQALVEAEGLTAAAVPRLVEGLFALGDEDAAVELLQRLAADKQATPAQRARAADELFYRRSYDRARVLYAAVLAERPDDAHALLRLGQIAAWTNDPRRALPYFERWLAVAGADADAAMVHFYLGETLWALGEPARARRLHEQSLAALQLLPTPDFTTRSTMATSLARLGQRSAAATAYRELVAENPRDVDLVLDYADVLLQGGDLAAVRPLLHHAELLAPEHARVLRMSGEVAARAGDLEAADRAFERTLAVLGSDAGVLGDLGQVRLAAGNWSGAQQSVARWLELQPDSLAAQRTDWQLRELLGTLASTEFRYQSIGRDRTVEAAAGGVVRLDDRRWLQGRLSAHTLRGAVASGEVEADFAQVDVAVGIRPGRSDLFAVGVSAAPGANGDLPIGLYAAGRFEWAEPQVSLQVRARWHELWSEPAAAAALGGRQSGISATSHCELGAGSWLAGGAGFDRLEIEPDSSPPLADSRVRADLSLGYRLVDGDVSVTSEFDPRVVPAGPSSPFLAASPSGTRPWLCNAWLSWRAARLLGDAALAGPLPLVAHDEHLVTTLRVDRHVARDFGASATGYTGFDLRTGQSIYGIEAALTWRPGFGSEFTVSGSHGAALGRVGGGDVDEVRLQMVLRW